MNSLRNGPSPESVASKCRQALEDTDSCEMVNMGVWHSHFSVDKRAVVSEVYILLAKHISIGFLDKKCLCNTHL